MIRMAHVKAIARAEARLTRRLARYWIFLTLSYLVALATYLQYAFLHGSYSSFSASVGVVSPRFLLSVIGLYYLIIYVIGTVFLAFDVRARDMRERMSEVLDSRPYTNLELVVGRFFGILLPSWIPILILAVLLEVIGMLLVALGSPIGDTMNIWSLFGFVFLMVLPALAFALSLVFLVTLLVRNRLVAAVLVLALLGINFWATIQLPMIYGRLFDVGGFASLNFPSEITPAVSSLDGLLQRLSLLCAAFGLLGFSAAVHPRLEGGSRAKLAFGGTGMIILALVFTGYGFFKNVGNIKIEEKWKAAHEALADIPVPDLLSVSGDVRIAPGKALDVELDLTFRAPDHTSLENAIFTLNPGQKVTAAVNTAGQPIGFTHENGLLDLTLPESLNPGEETTVHLSITGLPDNRFAFLESAINLRDVQGAGGGNIFLLGFDPAIFDSRYVALMPAIRWLPASGPETGRDDARGRPVDFFTVDLTVDLPDGWLAAGPGKRRRMEENADGERFRFSPGAPVPDVALMASRFESRGIEIEGVYMELLVHEKHMKNVELLADTGEKVQTWIREHLGEAGDKGFGYPYDGLAMVEVPSGLRTFGGGWRADSVMAPPGLLLMREIDFPMARFDTAFRNPEKYQDQEGGIVQAKFDRLKTFFSSDFSGSNVFTGAARNFLMYQTTARGPEALALNYVMENLYSLLTTDIAGYFSAHIFLDQGRTNQVINSTVNTYNTEKSMGTSITDAALAAATSTPGIWEKVLGISLKDMDPWEDPARTVDVLALKGSAVARSILDTLGREKTCRLLSSLCETYKGGSYSLEDLQTVGKALECDLDTLLGDWLGSTSLPGFVCSEARSYRLPDSDDGSPRYQLLVTVRNDEPVPGVFRLIRVHNEEGSPPESILGDPIRVTGKSAIRYGMVVSRPPSAVLLDPYLSLNRTKFGIQLPSINDDKIEKVDAIVGLEELPWALPEESFIVVDDLDPGFQTVDGGQNNGMRLNARKSTAGETDQGLPIRQYAYRVPSSWSRISLPMFYGKYRHTIAAVKSGKGEKKVAFTADIPRTGQWDLEVYIPFKQMIYPGRKWGTWHLTVTDGNGDEREVTFDSNAGSEGWNLTDNFDLPQGEVTVTLSDKTDGQFVIADAIRWVPAGGS